MPTEAKVDVLGGDGNGVEDEDDWGRRPGKSGTRTVTSVNSTSKLGRGVVVDVVVVVVVVVEDLTVDVTTVDDVAFECSVVDDETETVEWLALAGIIMSMICSVVDAADGVVVVVERDAFWSPNVFQMDGPTELNQGGLGLAVDDVGVAIVIWERNEFISFFPFIH